MPDLGDMKFDVDLSTGMITIGVRPPLLMESGRARCQISIMEFLDHAATLTLEMNKQARAVMRQMQNGVPVT